MKTILKNVQNAVVKYANVISQVLRVEVEIVDEKLVRIAGTGIFKDRTNKNMADEGYVYQRVIATGKPQIIKDPGNHQLCIPCPKRYKCEEKLEMCTPIIMKGKIIGVIGLICIDDGQKEYLLSNFNIYMDFLDQISEFISIAAKEKIEKTRDKNRVKLLNLAIDKMQQGIIVFNKDNCITHINRNGAKQLKFIGEYINEKVSIENIGDNVLDLKEYKLTINNQNFYIVGNIYPIKLNEEQFDKMMIFQDTLKFRKRISDITSLNKGISNKDILGDSPIMKKLRNNVKKIALSKSTTLITGESGTGKELFARAVHNESERKDEPFIPINCGAIPETLLESELFGYVKGAFTGADPMGKMGKFEMANKGTIFLDEIGDMPLYLQTKLLRVLQERRLTRVGSNKTISIDVRVIAATNKNLIKLIDENKFREDLYYRLNVIPFYIPALRERIQDIKILVEYFINKYTRLFDKEFKKVLVTNEVWSIFYNYSWPGNVRELENTVEFMINMVGTDGILDLNIIPKSIIYDQRKRKKAEHDLCTLKELEKKSIIKALKIYGKTTEGKIAAAKKLGIGIATLYRKMETYNLPK